MTFEEFQANVQGWSKERGIYEHSNALAQALKAVSEVGELADATIKNDIAELKDAIGDVAVCLVNVAYLMQIEVDQQCITTVNCGKPSTLSSAAHASRAVTVVASYITFNCLPPVLIDDAFMYLRACAIANNLDLLDCCEAAWHEIKDRKGHMVAGGAFVKELDL